MLNELFAAWDYSPSGISIRSEAPQWIRLFMSYIHTNMNEPDNQDVYLLLHRFSAYALRHATAMEKVALNAYLDNAITLSIDSMQLNIRELIDWLAFNNPNRAHYFDRTINEDAVYSDLRAAIWDGYATWAHIVLNHAKDYIITMREFDATA